MKITHRTFIFAFLVLYISVMSAGFVYATHFTEVPDNYKRVAELLSRGVCDKGKTTISQYATWGNTGYMLYRLETHMRKFFTISIGWDTIFILKLNFILGAKKKWSRFAFLTRNSANGLPSSPPLIFGKICICVKMTVTGMNHNENVHMTGRKFQSFFKTLLILSIFRCAKTQEGESIFIILCFELRNGLLFEFVENKTLILSQNVSSRLGSKNTFRLFRNSKYNTFGSRFCRYFGKCLAPLENCRIILGRKSVARFFCAFL